MTHLTISAHRWRIERGRYTIPLTPVKNRICEHCDGQEVENEYHFLHKCTNYVSERQALDLKLNNLYTDIRNLNATLRLLYLHGADTDVATM